MDHQDDITQPLYVAQEESPRGLSFDPTSWPYLVARARGTTSVIEARQFLARLEPWLATRTSLLVLWIDASPEPCPWFDDEAGHSIARWKERHRAELRGRRISMAFVSHHSSKRQYFERRLCKIESSHGVSLDVFASETSARGWLRVHAAAVATADAKLRRFAY
jgi:hypothetical protein